MLNYLWMGLLVLGIGVALTTDISDQVQNTYKNGEKLPVVIKFSEEYNSEEDKIEYDEDKVYKIRSRCAENLAKGPCKGCEYICNCSGGCVGQVVNETGDMMGIHEKNCKITKYLAERMKLNEKLHPVIHS